MTLLDIIDQVVFLEELATVVCFQENLKDVSHERRDITRAHLQSLAEVLVVTQVLGIPLLLSNLNR